jgi:hypothetical protein
MMLQMSDVREGGRFLGVGGFWVVGLITFFFFYLASFHLVII